MRSESEVIAIGNYCESLMREPAFNDLVVEFRQQSAQHILNTEPHEFKKRESVYAAIKGYDDFQSLMLLYVSSRDEIIKRNEQPSIPVEDDIGDDE